MNIELTEQQIEDLKTQIINEQAYELNKSSLIKKLGESSPEEMFKIILESLEFLNDKTQCKSDYIKDFLLEIHQQFKKINDRRKITLYIDNHSEKLRKSCQKLIGKKIDIVQKTSCHWWNKKIFTTLIFNAKYNNGSPSSWSEIEIFHKIQEDGVDYKKYYEETQKEMKNLLEGKIIENSYPCIYSNMYCQCFEVNGNKYHIAIYTPDFIDEDGYLIKDE